MLTITEGVTGSSVEMAIVLWLLLAGPFHSFLFAATLHENRYELRLEVRLQLGSYSLNQNNKTVIPNNAQEILSQLDTLLEESSCQLYKGLKLKLIETVQENFLTATQG